MLPWNLDTLNIEAVWDKGLTGINVRVGHLDTGVSNSHVSLKDKVAHFVSLDADGNLLETAFPEDSSGHGTHTAGIICGGQSNGQCIGIAPDVRLCSGVVIEGGKPLLRLLAGLDWMLDQNVRVLCVSLGIPGYNRIFEIILARLRQRGVLCVFPIGNSGRKLSHSPANYPGVLAVGAVDQENHVPKFSSSQTFARANDPVKPNLVAPGVDILSAEPNGGLSTQGGTSMAAAHIAGIAALMLQAKTDATVEDVEHALLTSCAPLPRVSPSRCGRGLVNPARALEVLHSSEPILPVKPIWENPKTPEIDSRLSRHLREASPTMQIDAIVIVVTDRQNPFEAMSDEGLGTCIIQQTIQQTNENPSFVRFIPRANAIFLTAPAGFINSLLNHPFIKIASSATIDPFFF